MLPTHIDEVTRLDRRPIPEIVGTLISHVKDCRRCQKAIAHIDAQKAAEEFYGDISDPQLRMAAIAGVIANSNPGDPLYADLGMEALMTKFIKNRFPRN